MALEIDEQQQQQDQGNNSQGNQQKQNGANGKGDAEKKDEKQEKSPEEKRKQRRNIIIFCVVLVIAALGGLIYYLHAKNYEDTDDAQVDGNLSPIGTRVQGTIVHVYVQDNDRVKVGDLLVDLDPQDDQVSFNQSSGQLAQAQASLDGQIPNVRIQEVQNVTNLLSAKANVASSEAALAAAGRDRDQSAAQVLQQEAANTKAQNDVKRYKLLVDEQEISKSDFDQYESQAKQAAANLQAGQSALLAAERKVDQSQAQLEQSKSQLDQTRLTAAPQLVTKRASVEQSRANVTTSSAQLDQARLNLGYTKIVSPVDGIVLERSAQIGSRVSVGQQLLTVSQVDYLWVTANFKETQLIHMRVGQRADIEVDALDRKFTGSVETIGGATGSIASTLPPENATGNYVKVVQRIPVRIKLDPNQVDLDRLRPGMSAEPNVRVE